MNKIWVLAIVLSASALAVATKQERVTNYRLRIKEEGVVFTETLEVNQIKRTAVVKVPAHNNVAKTEVMYDFEKNLTMLRDPDEKTCLLMPLDKQVPGPDKLVKFMNVPQSTSRGRHVRVRALTITSMKDVSDRSFLSDEMAKFCANCAIYQVKTEQDSGQISGVSSPPDQASDAPKNRPLTWSRFRRNKCNDRLTSQDIKRCRGGMCMASAIPRCRELNTGGSSTFYMPKLQCKIEITRCSYFMVCKKITNKSGYNHNFDCFKEHFIWNVKCCQYICAPFNGK